MFSLFATLLATQFMFLSDRASFWDPDKPSADTEQMGDTNSKASQVDFRQFKGKKVLLLVHGFNNSAEDAKTSYSQINDQMKVLLDANGKPLYDIIIGYLWPGCDSRFDYFSAEHNTNELVARVGLHLHALACFASEVDIFAHSMGNRLMLGALDYLSLHTEKPQTLNTLDCFGLLFAIKKLSCHNFFKTRQQTQPIQNFYSIAAAVDDDSIEKGHEYYNATQQCQNMYVFHSSRDDVLKFLFLVAEKDEALGYEGMDDPNSISNNIQFIDCTSFVDGHSGYFLTKPLYKFIQNQHAHQTPAPNKAPNVQLLANGLIEPKKVSKATPK